MSRIEPTPRLRRYSAFGLRIEADLALPELEPDMGSGPPDLRIRLGSAPSILDTEAPAAFRFQEDEALLSWRDVGDFRILGRDLIVYQPRAGVDEALVSLPLLGPVMGVLLERRGLLTLHGSAVELSAGVAVFLGDKGAGKSTTAAALVRAGKTLLTDDIVAVDCRGTPRLYPAYPQVKLTEEASASIAVDGEAMARPHPAFEKRRLRLDAPFDPAPREPKAALVLERGAAFALHPLRGAAALTALIRFSYATRFGRDLISGRSAADHLRQCAALSQKISVCRMVVPNDLGALAQLPDWLESEISRLDADAST